MIDQLDVHAFADRELAPEDMSRVEKEIAASPESTRELEAIRGLKTCLQTKMSPPECADAWKDCRVRLNELERVKKAEYFVGRYAWALCSVLFVVILGGGMLARLHGSSMPMGQVVSELGSMTPLQTPNLSHPEALRSFLLDQTGQSSTISSIPAQVVDVAYAIQPDGGRIVRIRLRDTEGIVALLYIPEATGVEGFQSIGDGMLAGQINRLNCVIRPEKGGMVMLIGNRDTSELRNFALSLYR